MTDLLIELRRVIERHRVGEKVIVAFIGAERRAAFVSPFLPVGQAINLTQRRDGA